MRVCDGGGDWHKAVSRVLNVEDNSLTGEPFGQTEYEVLFWRSAKHGTFVEINNGFGLIEEVIVPDDSDWLPFLNAHLAPMLKAVAETEVARRLERIGNALISWGRYGQGKHIDRFTALSRIDELDDENYRERTRRRA